MTPPLKPSLFSRRRFMQGTSLGLGVPLVGGLLAACGKVVGQTPAGIAIEQPHAQAEHAAAAPTAAPASGAPAYEAMDRMHVEGVQAFVAGVKTQGTGNQLLEPRMDGDVKVFELTAAPVQHEVAAGQFVEAWAYNGQVPGPQIRVREGDTVRIELTNNLPESTAIHFHGLLVPNSVDGVPGITQDPIKPGERYSYEFKVRNAGSHMYHSHHNATKQVGQGLLGAFIVDPADPTGEPEYDLDYVMVLNDQLGGFTLNGKGFPATAPLTAKAGQRVRIRYMNQGLTVHPMHLHGIPQLVVARDGWPQPQPWRCDTVTIAPGERWDVIVECDEAGVWAFHCHVLSHAESPHGMFGMVTALLVD
jgi:FtsP/CotA-like multicopper oxidase with cupredoxin domain